MTANDLLIEMSLLHEAYVAGKISSDELAIGLIDLSHRYLASKVQNGLINGNLIDPNN